jgi:hypothetical protein
MSWEATAGRSIVLCGCDRVVQLRRFWQTMGFTQVFEPSSDALTQTPCAGVAMFTVRAVHSQEG